MFGGAFSTFMHERDTEITEIVGALVGARTSRRTI